MVLKPNNNLDVGRIAHLKDICLAHWELRLTGPFHLLFFHPILAFVLERKRYHAPGHATALAHARTTFLFAVSKSEQLSESDGAARWSDGWRSRAGREVQCSADQ
jgi:hypothetical protein